jgi:hypothetical protein
VVKNNAALATALVLAAAGCGQPAMYAPPHIDQPVPTASGPPPPLADSPTTQIEQLHADLVARRAVLSLRTPAPAPDDACEPVCTIDDPPDKPTACTSGAGAACAKTCTQTAALCDDATKICEIAKQLRTEAWAAARCHDANASCGDARTACCGCT